MIKVSLKSEIRGNDTIFFFKETFLRVMHIIIIYLRNIYLYQLTMDVDK